MDILWAALAICAIVSVAFYALALSWQRMLRGHSRAIRGLFQRLEALEAMDDPLMRRRIGELMPSPLEQVHILSFRLGERFWRIRWARQSSRCATCMNTEHSSGP